MGLPQLADLTESEIRRLYRQFWTSGKFLSDWLDNQALFPLALRFKKPTSKDWSQHLLKLQARVRELEALGEKSPLQMTWEQIQTPVGKQLLPVQIEIKTRQAYLNWLGLNPEFERFCTLSEKLLSVFPALKPWLIKYPHKLLQYSEPIWEQIITVCQSLLHSPRPGLYLRELAVPGVDTKFIETHQGLLKELLDRLLPAEAIDLNVTGLSAQGFARRYGLRHDESLIRFRILDPSLRLHPALTDLSVPVSEFLQLQLPCRKIFICENKTNFLSFPEQAQSLVIFGSGKAAERLTRCLWLQNLELWYWGDLDSHGFGILAKLRQSFPQLNSILMDLPTLLNYRSDWGQEDVPTDFDTAFLTPAEREAYLALQSLSSGISIRLEQEKILQADLLNKLTLINEAAALN